MLHMQNIVLLCVFTFTLSAKLPSQFERCKIADFECLREKAEDAIQKTGDGIKKLGVPAYEPFIIPSVSVEQRPGPVSLSQTYSDVTLYGMSKTRLDNYTMNLDPDDCHIYMDMLTPKIEAKAKYVLKGQILALPLNADGEMEVLHENFRHKNSIKCEIYKKKGDDYLRIVDVKPEFVFGKVTFNMGEIFKGNPQLSEQIQKSINDNPEILLETVDPEFKHIWNQVIQSGANGFFSHIPLKEIFLDY